MLWQRVTQMGGKINTHSSDTALTLSPDSFKDHMCNILGQLESIFTRAVLSAFPEIANPVVQIQQSKHADYQCNAALALGKVTSVTKYCVVCYAIDDKRYINILPVIPAK